MLEAATWAPSHHLTEPWHFVVFSDDLPALGQFMAEQYKKDASSSSSSTGNRFVQAKYDKKRLNCTKASFVIAILCTLSSEQKEEDDGNTTTTKHNPAMEEVCSVAAAVQNMHLVATAHGVGAYWSTSGIYENKKAAFGTHNISLENPPTLRNFLNLKKNAVCLGWMLVGPYDGKKKWPQGRRNPCRVQRR
jgi:nitroreductase